MCGFTTTPRYVEILNFKHFVGHTVCNSESEKFRNKKLKNYVNVKVVIDMETIAFLSQKKI